MLGDRLKLLREKSGLNQEEFSKIIGVARGTYAHYEINKRMPAYDILEKIADYYHVSLDFLIRGKKIDANSHLFDFSGLDETEINDIKKHVEYIKWKSGR